MNKEGHATSVIHGGMPPNERDTRIDEFRRGITKVLISTDVLARGIDILQVSVVINFDLPLGLDRQPSPETYLHRIGRTGRFGRSGVAINFIHDDMSQRHLWALQKFFGREIKEVETDDLEKLEATLNGTSRVTQG